ncbi:MAG: amidohydrolase [Firmicutes bacterium]|nr:amidohydrolase [Bacillota bacterium]
MKTAYVNGVIYTMREEGETIRAFVVEDGEFICCGSDEEAKAIADEVVDLGGKTVLPGFIDTHQHLYSYAKDLTKLNLKGTKSLEELQARIAEKAATLQPGEWIQGTGFDHEDFPVKELPTRWDLDKAAPENPVLITRYDLHINCSNNLALKLAGIDKDYVPEVDNTVLYDENGEPNGVIMDQVAADMSALIPDPMATREQKLDALEMACHDLNKAGLTGVHPIQAKHVDLFEDLGLYQDLNDQGRLTARIYFGYDALPGLGMRYGLGDSMVKYGFYKLFTDGSLGARTALLNEPYTDDPTKIGITNHTQEELDALVKEAWDLGLQIGVHQIGDRAIEMVVESLEKAYAANPRTDARFRMIHMSLVNEDIIRRMKKLPVILDIQPMFVSTNVRWSETRVGPERAKYNYAWKSFIDEGFILTAGSDSPIETFDPMKGSYAIVTRQGMDGYPEGGWYPEQRVSPYEALCMYTKNAAYASYEEDVKGTIEEGKYADFVILDRNVFEIPHSEIKDVTVEKTYLGGRLVYEK